MTRASDLGVVSWYGDDESAPWSFVAPEPPGYDGRYRATGTLMAEGFAAEPVLRSVTITEIDTGDAVTFDGTRATLTCRSVASGEHVRALWRDARKIAKSARGLGGPPRGTGVTPDVLVQVAAEHGEPTEEEAAEILGVTDRRVRQVAASVGGWDAVLQMARTRRMSSG